MLYVQRVCDVVIREAPPKGDDDERCVYACLKDVRGFVDGGAE